MPRPSSSSRASLLGQAPPSPPPTCSPSVPRSHNHLPTKRTTKACPLSRLPPSPSPSLLPSPLQALSTRTLKMALRSPPTSPPSPFGPYPSHIARLSHHLNGVTRTRPPRRNPPTPTPLLDSLTTLHHPITHQRLSQRRRRRRMKMRRISSRVSMFRQVSSSQDMARRSWARSSS